MKQTSGFLSLRDFLTSHQYIAVPLRQNIAGLLLVKATINGQEGEYILDTGAGQTVIDDCQVSPLNLILNHLEMEHTGGGVGAHGIENIPSYNNVLNMNGFILNDFTVAVMTLNTAWQSLAAVGAHDTLFGIIGFDVLDRGKAIIDYSSRTLFLKLATSETK